MITRKQIDTALNAVLAEKKYEPTDPSDGKERMKEVDKFHASHRAAANKHAQKLIPHAEGIGEPAEHVSNLLHMFSLGQISRKDVYVELRATVEAERIDLTAPCGSEDCGCDDDE